MKELALKQVEIITVIVLYNNDHGFAPTVFKISDMVGQNSSSTVQQHLDNSHNMGIIERNPPNPRTIRVMLGGHAL